MAKRLRQHSHHHEGDDRGQGGNCGSIICNDLTSVFDDFRGASRQKFCTGIAATVAEIVAEILLRLGALEGIAPVAGLEDDPRTGAGVDILKYNK